MENGNLVDLIEQENVETALRQVNDIISTFLKNEYNLDSLKLSRIDFCVNINVGSQKAADTYIKLLNFKNGNYGRFRIKNINSPKGYSKNGFLAETAANDIAISVYSKKAQPLSIKRESEAVRAEKNTPLGSSAETSFSHSKILSQRYDKYRAYQNDGQ